MDEIHPLNVQVTEKRFYNGDTPVLWFSYNRNGKQKNLGRFLKNHPKIDIYLKIKNIKLDLSSVHNSNDAQKFKEKFVASYPYPKDIYKHLHQLEILSQKELKHQKTFLCAHEFVHNQLAKNPKNEDKIQIYSFIKQLFKAGAEGKNIKHLTPKRSFFHFFTLKEDILYNQKLEIINSFTKNPPSRDICRKIYNALPDEIFKSLEDIKDFEFNSGYGSRKKAFEFRNMRIKNFEIIAENLLDIKIRDEINKALNKQLSAHLQKIEKIKRIVNYKNITFKNFAQKVYFPLSSQRSKDSSSFNRFKNPSFSYINTIS